PSRSNSPAPRLILGSSPRMTVEVEALVADARQVEAVRRRHRSTRGPVLRRQRGRHILDGPAALSDLGESAGHGADLAVQEAARLELQTDLVAVAEDAGDVQR